MKITGTVCYADNLTKIPFCMVNLIKRNDPTFAPKFTQADANGCYEFDNLTPGYYQITGVCGTQKFDYVKPVQADVDFINSVIAGNTPFPTDKAIVIAGTQIGNPDATAFLPSDAQWVTDLMNGVIVIPNSPDKGGLRFEQQNIELVDSDVSGISIRGVFFGDTTLQAFQQGYTPQQITLYNNLYQMVYGQVSGNILSGSQAGTVLDAVKQKVD